jgi:hypothetical protein
MNMNGGISNGVARAARVGRSIPELRLTAFIAGPYWISSMGEQHGHHKPLHERIKERIKHLVDEVVGTLDGLVNPEPARLPVPVRSKYRR